MADEIEIKLKASEQALKAVRKLGWLMDLAQGKPKRKNLRSIYFDTAKRKLRENGLTLRVRHVGKKHLQTVKADSKGVFVRHEWECAIAGDKPDLSVLPPEVRKRLGKETSLRPVFETVVTRTTFALLCNGSEIELALDSGIVKAGRRHAPIREIEIELKHGDTADIVTLAERLAGEIAVSFEVRAKSDRGYALAAGELGAVSQARDPQLDEPMTAAEAFRTIAMECVRHLSCNEEAVLGGHAEGVHQMRVGLRRLRAAISLFREMLADSQSLAVDSELKWLAAQLASSRDIDVFVRESITPLADAVIGMAALKKDMEQRRDEAFTRARIAVEGQRYHRLVLQIVLWLSNGLWGSDADLMQRARRDRPILAFASETLSTRSRKVNKKVLKLKTLEPQARHKLRIAVKKLRYAGEFFATLYNGKKAKTRQQKIGANLEALQNALGRLNDFSVHQNMVTDIIAGDGRADDDNPKEAYGFGVVTGHELGESATILAAACKAGERLNMQKPFWS